MHYKLNYKLPEQYIFIYDMKYVYFYFYLISNFMNLAFKTHITKIQFKQQVRTYSSLIGYEINHRIIKKRLSTNFYLLLGTGPNFFNLVRVIKMLVE